MVRFYGSVASVQNKYKSLIWTLFYDANEIKDLYVEFLGFNSWSFFNILTISIPAIVLFADSNSLNPKPCIIRHLIIRWSCSTILLRYLHCLILMREQFLLLYSFIAELLAPLLSIFISSGLPLSVMALIKNLWADIRCLLLVKRKSTVLPSLSTALYKYLHSPFTFI